MWSADEAGKPGGAGKQLIRRRFAGFHASRASFVPTPGGWWITGRLATEKFPAPKAAAAGVGIARERVMLFCRQSAAACVDFFVGSPVFRWNVKLVKIRIALRGGMIWTSWVRYEPIPSELFIRNRDKLRSLLKPNSLVIVHSNDIYPTNADGTMSFHQNSDLYHLTGVSQEETTLVLMPDAVDPKEREILFVRETSELIAVWEGEKLSKEKAKAVTGIERIEWSSAFDGFLHRMIPQMEHVYLTTNEHLRASTIVETRNARFIKECQARYPLHRYERLAPLMHKLRIIKDEVEIGLIRKACDITEAGFRRLLGFINPGVGEWEIEAELLHEFVRRGSRGFAYGPIIGTGKNACVLHYVENEAVCGDGDMVLLDVAAEWRGWNSDLTRTVPVNGRFSKRQRQVYDAVLRVFRGANDLLRPGNTPIEYQKQVMELMDGELVGLGLYTAAEAKAQGPDKPLMKKYFMHGTSHHLGLDVHDVSPPHEAFAEGMVFTIEPGIYIREENLGVRLENDVWIGKDANTDLMAGIPIEADEIEELMAAGRK
jgi:Xaa-Pro aminopeptidase